MEDGEGEKNNTEKNDLDKRRKEMKEEKLKKVKAKKRDAALPEKQIKKVILEILKNLFMAPHTVQGHAPFPRLLIKFLFSKKPEFKKVKKLKQ